MTNPEDQIDMGQTGRRVARSQARPALAGPWKSCPGRVFAALWARARLRFGPQVTHVAPFLLVPINTPPGFEEKDIQRIELYLLLC